MTPVTERKTREKTGAGTGAGADADAKETRDRRRPLYVYVAPSEREKIAGLAASAGMSVSDYLRTAGLNRPIRPVADKEAAAYLLKVNGDMGRLGGLLKQWLNNKPGSGASVRDVCDTLDDIRKLQQQMRAAVSAVTGRKRQ